MDSSDRLNVGDVTGPRWAGGTRNPASMDSSNAEKGEDMSVVADRVRRAIALDGRSHKEFAEVIGIDPTKLSKSLHGKRAFSSYELACIASETKFSVFQLLGVPDPADEWIATLREQLAAAEARAVRAELEWAEADARTVLAVAARAAAWDEGARYVTHDSTYTELFDIPENPYRSGTEGSTDV